MPLPAQPKLNLSHHRPFPPLPAPPKTRPPAGSLESTMLGFRVTPPQVAFPIPAIMPYLITPEGSGPPPQPFPKKNPLVFGTGNTVNRRTRLRPSPQISSKTGERRVYVLIRHIQPYQRTPKMAPVPSNKANTIAPGPNGIICYRVSTHLQLQNNQFRKIQAARHSKNADSGP